LEKFVIVLALSKFVLNSHLEKFVIVLALSKFVLNSHLEKLVIVLALQKFCARITLRKIRDRFSTSKISGLFLDLVNNRDFLKIVKKERFFGTFPFSRCICLHLRRARFQLCKKKSFLGAQKLRSTGLGVIIQKFQLRQSSVRFGLGSNARFHAW
jgi:hypothetical protein